jgi:hypothetical protein
MSKTYSLLLNINVETEKTSDGKSLHNYSFKAWKNGIITKQARAFDWTEPMVKKQGRNLQKLGENIFSVIQEMATEND